MVVNFVCSQFSLLTFEREIDYTMRYFIFSDTEFRDLFSNGRRTKLEFILYTC